MVKMISHGSYGCIFYPGMDCKGKPMHTKKGKRPEFVTKIQRKKATSIVEEEVGKKIMNIKNYEDFFAPVIDSCPLSIGSIENDEIKKCDFLSKSVDINNDVKFQSNKLKYVGKHTFSSYLMKLFKTHPKRLFRTIMNSYRHLLKGIDLLASNGLIHYDIHDRNVMVDSKKTNPILIDFGLTIQNMPDCDKKGFYVYAPDYDVWCFDICLINYLLHEVSTESTERISSEVLFKVLNEYIQKNGVWEHFTSDEKDKYKTQMQTYLKGLENKSAEDIIDELIGYWKSWDNYSVSVLFLSNLNMFGNGIGIDIGNDIEKDFKESLKKIVASTPSERPIAKTTILETKQKYSIH